MGAAKKAARAKRMEAVASKAPAAALLIIVRAEAAAAPLIVVRPEAAAALLMEAAVRPTTSAPVILALRQKRKQLRA